MEILRFKIKVIGRVQGVWFRKFTKVEADKIGVKGFVQNKTDGSVYIEAEGSTLQLTEFISLLNKGSYMSDVRNVNATKGALRSFDQFVIRG